uniref:Mitochondrial S-adenosylmethionine carrier protein n=1 Tax=Erpetoichthys calabaricus TaxID=27687 RepID=A0A8C4XDC5_ERPCA
MHRREFTASLVAGGIAGMCVDLVLYPLDTIKTRLQSPQGFFKASGFRGIYAGVPSVAIGSFPSASAFFVTYEYFKSVLSTFSPPYLSPVIHMVSASLGETVACVIRVPTEVVKQRTQASPSTSTYRILLLTLREEGILGLYRGYSSTVLRECKKVWTKIKGWGSRTESRLMTILQRVLIEHNGPSWSITSLLSTQCWLLDVQVCE